MRRLDIVLVVIIIFVRSAVLVDERVLVVAGEGILGGFLDVVRRSREIFEGRNRVALEVPRAVDGDCACNEPENPNVESASHSRGQVPPSYIPHDGTQCDRGFVHLARLRPFACPGLEHRAPALLLEVCVLLLLHPG